KIQQFTLITLPLLLLALGPMLVGSFAFSFNNFAGIYLLTSGGPVMAAGVLPGHTDILISYTYKLAFGEQNKDYGLASSIAIIVFLIIGTITFLQFKFTGAFKEVDNA
ncbi:MAG TPA: maltose ABC transporter permease, partial [Spirochaetota bacterium]|nr:maltose ABC transporter permease [Spirochaetota bacterium]